MKKLLAVSLFMFSSMAFADTITPELLVGKWHCKGDFSYPNVTGTRNYVEIFEKSGIVESNSVLREVDNGKENVIVIGKQGKWLLQGSVLSKNTETLFDYYVNDKALEKKNKLEEFLINDKSFHNFAILNFTKNNFQIKPVLDEKEDGKFLYTCNRMED